MTQTRTMNVDGTTRTFRLYVPAMYNGQTQVPLVFNFHGYTSDAQEQEFYGDFRPIADTANFILVHPQGTDPGTGTFWNSFANTDASNFDYRFVNEMIDSLSAEFSIDSHRIYATGMSNGGFFSYDMACFMGNTFAAVASVTGSMISTHITTCTTSRKVPVMQIHGTADPTVSYTGTGGIVSSVHIDSLVKFWVLKNECSLVPQTSAVPNISATDNCTATHDVYFSNGDNLVEFFKVQGGGHTWPGSVFPIIGQNTSQDFSASKEIWRFFSEHSLPQSATVEEHTDINFELFPNPSQELVTISYKGEKADAEVRDGSGQLIKNFTIQEGMNELKLGELQRGIYFIQVGNSRLKFIKN